MKKLKYILWFLLVFISFIKVNWDYEIDVKPSILPGNYDSVLELYLQTNAYKVFYYTNRIWNIYDLIEYTKPILIKEDTYINFFSLKKDSYDTSFIKEVFYKIDYSHQIDITYKYWVVYIKNNSSKTQNIWYWKIYWEFLNLELFKNTILEPGQTYEIFHEMQVWEEIFLYSPDNKIIKNYKYSPLIISNNINSEIKIEEKNIQKQIENNTWITDIQTWEINLENTQTWENNSNVILENTWVVNNYLKSKNIVNITKNTKSSIIETKNNSNLPLIFIFSTIILWLLVYNMIIIFQDNNWYKYFKKKK